VYGASDEWVAIYKFARMAFLALCLLGIALYLYHPSRRQRLEEPARRMLEEDDA
jgi:cbb3-type cytochrome oxidase subunit 3